MNHIVVTFEYVFRGDNMQEGEKGTMINNIDIHIHITMVLRTGRRCHAVAYSYAE